MPRIRERKPDRAVYIPRARRSQLTQSNKPNEPEQNSSTSNQLSSITASNKNSDDNCNTNGKRNLSY